MRVAYTLEQLWHDAPGGTAVAALEVARRLVPRGEITLLGVAARHRRPPAPPWRPPIPVAQLPLPRPLLYESWLRARRPAVERATGPVDVAHATGLVPCPTAAPLVVTVHDLAFLRDPTKFTRQGVRVMRRSLDVIRGAATLVLTSSEASRRDLEVAGIEAARLRVIPLGVDAAPAAAVDVERVRRHHDLPERFVLFVGTLEPRKNLRRLAAAVARLDDPLPLVVAGPDGWGPGTEGVVGDAQFLGFVPREDLPGLYSAATVFAYPSEVEGFGLPVAEAMAQGTPVVTSAGTATEEVAAGAAVLVDPFDVDSIAGGARRGAAAARRARRGRTPPGGRAHVGGHRATHPRRLPRRRPGTPSPRRHEDAMTELVVGVNLLWCLPGEVGGSEEYLARQLVGLHDADPGIITRLFVLPGFAAAHRDVAARHELVVASLDARRRSWRVVVEATWLPRQLVGTDVVHHGGGTVPARSPDPIVLTVHDLQYRTYPAYFPAVKRRYLQVTMPRSVRRATVVAVPSEYVRATVIDALRDRSRCGGGGAPRARPATAGRRHRRGARCAGATGSATAVSSSTRRSPTPTRTTASCSTCCPGRGATQASPSSCSAGAASPTTTSPARIAGHGLGGRVIRPGRVPDEDRDGLVAAADALVYPSEYEGFGAPVLEAMALGTPVVCSDRAALPEVAGDAALVLPLDRDAWAGALDTIAARHDFMVSAGRRRAGQFTTRAAGRDSPPPTTWPRRGRTGWRHDGAVAADRALPALRSRHRTDRPGHDADRRRARRTRPPHRRRDLAPVVPRPPRRDPDGPAGSPVPSGPRGARSAGCTRFPAATSAISSAGCSASSGSPPSPAGRGWARVDGSAAPTP